MRTLLLALAAGVAQLALHRIAAFSELTPGVYAWYPGAALMVALPFGAQWACLPALLAGTLISDLVLFPTGIGFGWDLLANVWCLSVYAAGAILARRAGVDPRSGSPQQLFRFVRSIPVMTSPVAALGGVACFVFAGLTPPEDAITAFFAWWIGDAIGVIALAPALLTWLFPSPDSNATAITPVEHGLWASGPRPLARRVEIAALLAFGGLALVLALAPPAALADPASRPVILFVLPASWAALRFGWRGATVASAASAIAIAGGVWMRPAENHPIATHLVSIVVCFGGLVIGSLASAQRRARAELIDARDHALAAARTRSAFLANMSHEIRTPMNGVIGLATVLLDEPLEPRARDLTETIHRSAESLLALLNDILDISKIEAGHLTIEEAEVEPRALVADVMGIFERTPRREGVALRAHVADDVPAVLRGDPIRVRQVLVNLVGNALKFTSQGAVDVQVERRGNSHPSARVRFAVRDTGIGIAHEQQSRIFDPFEQADSSTTRRFGGTGLGLAICKRLAELMAGTIGVESHLGAGSTFWLELPLRAIDRPASATPARSLTPPSSTARVALPPLVTRDGRRPRILVAEDNVVNQRVARETLARLGCDVEMAGDGREALLRATDEIFDAILMDCHMPVLDGFAATREIRDREAGGRHIPIIAMTASVMDEERRRCFESGMDDFLAKPVKRELVRETLARWLGEAKDASAAS